MFNLGFMEIVIIGVLALILIGPKQLPEMARVLARLMNEFKKATSELSGGLLEVQKELRKPLQDGLDAVNRLKDEVSKMPQEAVDKYVNSQIDPKEHQKEEAKPKDESESTES